MRHWFRDTHFRSLLKNSSYLALSKVVAAICGVATLAFAGRGLRRHAVRNPDSHHQLRQGGERAEQVPVLAIDHPLRRPGARQRRPGRFQGIDGFRLRPGRGERNRRNDPRRYLASVPWELVRHSRSVPLARHALLHLAPDHGRGDACGRASRSGPVRPHRLAGKLLSHRPGYLGGHSIRNGRTDSKSMSPSGSPPISPATCSCGSSPGASCAAAACSTASARR